MLRGFWRLAGLALNLAVIGGLAGLTPEPAAPSAVEPAPAFGERFPGAAIRFEQLALKDGLSQNTCQALWQDRQGYMWVGTQDGLNRYDGYTFTVFRHDPADPNSLGFNEVTALAEDAEGVLWIGTPGEGVDRYDARTGKFTHYRHNANDPTSLSDNEVTVIFQDRSGRMWIGTQGGLNRFEPAAKNFTHYHFDPAAADSLSSENISALAESADGRLWVGTHGLGLNRLKPETGEVERYLHLSTRENSVASNNIAGLYEDASGGLWIATGGDNLPGAGLDRLDIKTGQFIHYQTDPNAAHSLSSNTLSGLYADAAGTLWVGTTEAGLDRMDLQTPGYFLHYQQDIYNPYSLSGNSVRSLYADRSGVVWVGTTEAGLNRFNRQTQQFALYQNSLTDLHSVTAGQVSAFLEDNHGQVWVGIQGGGVDVYYPYAGVFTHHRHNPENPDSLGSNMVNDVYQDREGRIWIATQWGGLSYVKPDTWQWTHYYHDPARPDSLIDDSTQVVLQDAYGDIWVATAGGLDRYETATGQFSHYRNQPGNPHSLSNDRVVAMYLDQHNILWLGTWGGGLNSLDLAQVDSRDPARAWFTRYLNIPNSPQSLGDNSVWAIYEDQAGVMWFGTQSGLNRFDRKTGVFKTYTPKEGLPNAAARCIVEDDFGQIWIGTNNGLVRFDPAQATFRVYDVADGLQSNEFTAGACARAQDGRLYFGGTQGFNAFYPAEVHANPYPPPLVITAFSIFNKPVNADLSGQQPLRLAYQENFIAFEFAALDYRAPDKNQYAYKLDGVDRDWIYAGPRRYASYTNLKGGEYVFRVKGSNNDGVWNEAGTAVTVIVTPPLWERLWFQILVALGLAVVGLGGVGWWWQTLRRQKGELEKQVALRTAELQQEVEQRRKVEEALTQQATAAAVAAERNRLARDLHDAVTQTLFSAGLIADILPDLWDLNRVEARRRLAELRQLTRGALAEMRTLLVELRPSALTEAPLADLLRQFAEALAGRTRLPIEVMVEGQRKLPPEVQVAFYRIAQEALNNISKHARAGRADINLRLADTVRLSIMDNGLGFDPQAIPADHFGVKIMHERAEAVGAKLMIYSEPGEGTQITVIWPDKESL